MTKDYKKAGKNRPHTFFISQILRIIRRKICLHKLSEIHRQTTCIAILVIVFCVQQNPVAYP